MRLFGPILVLTLIEIALFITVGGWLGLGLSLLVILGTAVLGSGLLRLQGQRMALDLRQAMNGIGDPLSPMAQRGLIMMAAILLILPGFLGDTLERKTRIVTPLLVSNRPHCISIAPGPTFSTMCTPVPDAVQRTM